MSTAPPGPLNPVTFAADWREREAELLAALRITAVRPPRDDPVLLAALEQSCSAHLLALRRAAVDFVIKALAARDAAIAERDAARADALRLEGALRGTRARLVEASAAARVAVSATDVFATSAPAPHVKARARSAGAASLRAAAPPVAQEPYTPRRVAILEAATPLAKLHQAPAWAVEAPRARAWTASLRAENGASPSSRPSFQLPRGSRSAA